MSLNLGDLSVFPFPWGHILILSLHDLFSFTWTLLFLYIKSCWYWGKKTGNSSHTFLYWGSFREDIMDLKFSLELWEGMNLNCFWKHQKPREDGLGRQDASFIWGSQLIYCETYSLFPSKTLPFIDAARNLSAGNFRICPNLEIPIQQILPLGLWYTGRSRTLGKFNMKWSLGILFF